MTTNKFSILAYELINDKYSKAKYLGIECIMETKTGYINATKFCEKAQKTPKDTEAQKKPEDTEAQTPEDTESQKTEDTEAQTPDDTEAQKTRCTKVFKDY